MTMKRLPIVGVTLIILGMLATPALAGGWAVITLDELPPQVSVNQPLSIGFTVRQHGQTPVSLDAVRVAATNSVTGQFVEAEASEWGPIGHYQATLLLPSAGEWRWEIDATLGLGQQPLPPLIVKSAGDARRGEVQAPLVLFTYDGAAAANALLARLPATRHSQEAIGEALFLAKGCVVCHNHEAVADERQSLAGFSVGPNLTGLNLDEGFLHAWLKDPAAIKPTTDMPTLGLSDPEIDALVAFLNSNSAANR